MRNVVKIVFIVIVLYLLTACGHTMTQYVPRAQTKAPAIAKQRGISKPALLPDGANMGDVISVAGHNGTNLNMCLISLDAAQKYLDQTGQ